MIIISLQQFLLYEGQSLYPDAKIKPEFDFNEKK